MSGPPIPPPPQNESLLKTLFCCFEFCPRAMATALPPLQCSLFCSLCFCVFCCVFLLKIQGLVGLVRFGLGFVKSVTDPLLLLLFYVSLFWLVLLWSSLPAAGTPFLPPPLLLEALEKQDKMFTKNVYL